MVLVFLTGPDWMESPSARIVIVPAVVVCPPGWLFWSAMDRPDDLRFALELCGLAMVFNAFVFAPVGVVHGYTLSLRPAVRRGLVGAGLMLTLALGHAFFMSEPALLAALLRQLAG